MANELSLTDVEKDVCRGPANRLAVDGSVDSGRGPRLLRLRQVLTPHGPIPMSKSAWWQGVREGRLPQPLKLGPKTPVWRSCDIEALVSRGVDDAAPA